MRQLGKIKCLETLYSSQQNEVDQADWMILFHGFGADAYDLQTLSEVLAPGMKMNFLFPQGIKEVPIGPGWTGRAWWQIDMMALERRMNSQEKVDLSDSYSHEVPDVRAKIFEMIKQMNVPWNKIILGGFSQGSMLATDIFLNAPETPKGLVILSGNLVNKTEWKNLAPKRAGSKFFMSHGTHDQVLPISGASRLESLLTAAGLKGSLFSFPGAHEIPMSAISKVNEYLKNL